MNFPNIWEDDQIHVLIGQDLKIRVTVARTLGDAELVKPEDQRTQINELPLATNSIIEVMENLLERWVRIEWKTRTSKGGLRLHGRDRIIYDVARIGPRNQGLRLKIQDPRDIGDLFKTILKGYDVQVEFAAHLSSHYYTPIIGEIHHLKESEGNEE